MLCPTKSTHESVRAILYIFLAQNIPNKAFVSMANYRRDNVLFILFLLNKGKKNHETHGCSFFKGLDCEIILGVAIYSHIE